MGTSIRWTSAAFGSAIGAILFSVSAAEGVPIDLTDATPSVTGATTLNFNGIVAVGSMWWADFEWNENRMRFDLTTYGEETNLTLSHGLDWAGVESGLLDSGPSPQGVPIDLTDATPAVTGATTLHIEGIATLGASYWADFEWNEKTNGFEVSAYGEEELRPPLEGFAWIDAGTFTMGSPEDELERDTDETQHDVTLTGSFYLSEVEVTQAQWVSVMGSNPSYFSGCDDCPVEQVSWYDAVDYCNALSALEGLSLAYEVNAHERELGPGSRWIPATDRVGVGIRVSRRKHDRILQWPDYGNQVRYA